MRGINYHLRFYAITVVNSDWLTFNSKQKHKALSNGAMKKHIKMITSSHGNLCKYNITQLKRFSLHL